MSFSKILNNKTLFCIKNRQNVNFISNYKSFSINFKCFHSLNSVKPKNRFIDHKLRLKTTVSHRCLSAITTDTTISIKPELITGADNVLDLSSATGSALVDTIATNSDLPITALGLASNYTPIGWTLHLLEGIHDVLPWYATIALATLCLRLIMFPLVIKAQRNAMKMNQVMPQLQELQQKSTNARLSGNQFEFAKYVQQQQDLMTKNDISPFKSMLVPLAQAPVFVTFFMTLRRMAQFPVQSLKVGGILWFVDLTVPDPYHLLPVITSLSLWAALELGVEAGVSQNSSVFIRTAMRCIPAITLIFIWNFESAILMYWCSSNFISLLQVLLLKQPRIREYLKIPLQIKHKADALPVSKKGFYESIKESMDNSKIYKKIEDRKRIDEMNFKRAAIGPIKKTFKADPTKLQHRN